MKRSRSRSPSEPQKRQRQGGGLSRLFALDELFLRVLSFLDAGDLARAQRVSRHWERMCLDPQLWKHLYLERYPHPHRPKLVYTRSRSATPLRPLARLPSRAFPPPSPPQSPTPEGYHHDRVNHVRHEGVDWKVMMRLGTNWANGSVSAESSVPLPPRPQGDYTQHHMALFPSFICTSSPASPLVHVYNVNGGNSLGIVPPPPGWSSPSRPDMVTALCADQAVIPSPGGPSPARLAIMYASGGFAVVRLRVAEGRLVWTRENVCNTRSRPPRQSSAHTAREDDYVVFGAMHYPSLVTCTRGFLLSIYSLAEGTPLLLGALRSDVSFHPAALSLFPENSKTGFKFRAALTYCTPVYPTSWTISIQELSIDVDRTEISRGECHHVSHTLDKDHWPRRIEPVAGIRGKAVGVGTDGRWCVLAGDDSVIHVYALPGSPYADIAHAQTLLAPSAGVTSLALSAGRCVTGGKDGRVLVWELDVGLDDEEEDEARVGRAAQFVEIKAGGRREPSPPMVPTKIDDDSPALLTLPHPTAISSAARSMFLASPPASFPPASPSSRTETTTTKGDSGTAAIRQLAFDEEKIVGLVDGPGGDILRVWSFS